MVQLSDAVKRLMVRNTNWEGYRKIAWTGVILLALALVVVVTQAKWTADFFVEKQIVSGLGDTVTDLILDSAGALFAALLNLWGLNELSRAEKAAQAQGRDHLTNRPARLTETSGEVAG